MAMLREALSCWWSEMPEFPVALGFYEDESRPISSQSCVNLIPQVPQALALSAEQLRSPSGIVEFLPGGNSPARGEHTMKGVPYYVSGNTLYGVHQVTETTGTLVSLGIITGAGKVSMEDNGLQLCIVVPGSTAYIYSVAGGLVTITDSDFTTTLGPSQQVEFIDGYFLHFNNNANASTSPIFFISGLNNGLLFDALDFATAESDPDEITGIHVTRSQLHVCGGVTIEPFANIGGAGFPFQTIRGGVVPKGVKAKFSLVEFDESFVFVGGGLHELISIWKYTGSSGQKISSAAIDNVLQELTDIEQKAIFCTVYGEYGGFFVNIHLKDKVFTFDSMASALTNTPRWHERKSKDVFGRDAPWRVNGILQAFGKILVTDNQDGRIGLLDRKTTSDYGEFPIREFTMMPFKAEGERVTIAEVELTCQSGVGLTNQPEPQVVKSYSDDGGYTFSNGAARGLGLPGQYKKRQIWYMDGQMERFRVYRFTFSGSGKITVIKFEADLVQDID